MTLACGIDIGGSGVKGALVDLETGTYSCESVVIETPTPATPDSVAQVCGDLLRQLGVTDDIAVGITMDEFPSWRTLIQHGQESMLSNSWIVTWGEPLLL